MSKNFYKILKFYIISSIIFLVFLFVENIIQYTKFIDNIKENKKFMNLDLNKSSDYKYILLKLEEIKIQIEKENDQ